MCVVFFFSVVGPCLSLFIDCLPLVRSLFVQAPCILCVVSCLAFCALLIAPLCFHMFALVVSVLPLGCVLCFLWLPHVCVAIGVCVFLVCVLCVSGCCFCVCVFCLVFDFLLFVIGCIIGCSSYDCLCDDVLVCVSVCVTVCVVVGCVCHLYCCHSCVPRLNLFFF